MNDIRAEYQRLERHPLSTVTQSTQNWILQSDLNCERIIISNINAQSLQAHSKDISDDELISQSDFLGLRETWMDADNLVEIDTYKLITQKFCENWTGVLLCIQKPILVGESSLFLSIRRMMKIWLT